jgi:YVTN family beta-propeller protein
MPRNWEFQSVYVKREQGRRSPEPRDYATRDTLVDLEGPRAYKSAYLGGQNGNSEQLSQFKKEETTMKARVVLLRGLVMAVVSLLATDGRVRASGDTQFNLSNACNCVVATIPVGKGPGVVGVNPLTNLMYVSNLGRPEGTGDTVSVINGATNTVVATIPVGKGPAQIGVNPLTNLIYVPNRGASANGNTVSVIDGATNTVVATIPAARHLSLLV